MSNRQKLEFSRINTEWTGVIGERKIIVHMIDWFGRVKRPNGTICKLHGDTARLSAMRNRRELEVIPYRQEEGTNKALEEIYQYQLSHPKDFHIISISMSGLTSEKAMLDSKGPWQKCARLGAFIVASAGNTGVNGTSLPGHGFMCCSVTPCNINVNPIPFYVKYGTRNQENDVCYFTGNKVEGYAIDGKTYINTTFSGTSDSAPAFSGDIVVEVVTWFFLVHGRWPNHNEIYTMIINSCFDMEEPGHDIKTGHGVPRACLKYDMHWSDWHRNYKLDKLEFTLDQLEEPENFATRKYVIDGFAHMLGYRPKPSSTDSTVVTWLNAVCKEDIIMGRKIKDADGDYTIDLALNEPITRGEVHIIHARILKATRGQELIEGMAFDLREISTFTNYEEYIMHCIDYCAQFNIKIYSRDIWEQYIKVCSIDTIHARHGGFVEWDENNAYD